MRPRRLQIKHYSLRVDNVTKEKTHIIFSSHSLTSLVTQIYFAKLIRLKLGSICVGVVADLRGTARDAPFGSKFSSFWMYLLGKIGQIVGWRPPSPCVGIRDVAVAVCGMLLPRKCSVIKCCCRELSRQQKSCCQESSRQHNFMTKHFLGKKFLSPATRQDSQNEAEKFCC